MLIWCKRKKIVDDWLTNTSSIDCSKSIGLPTHTVTKCLRKQLKEKAPRVRSTRRALAHTRNSTRPPVISSSRDLLTTTSHLPRKLSNLPSNLPTSSRDLSTTTSHLPRKLSNLPSNLPTTTRLVSGAFLSVVGPIILPLPPLAPTSPKLQRLVMPRRPLPYHCTSRRHLVARLPPVNTSVSLLGYLLGYYPTQPPSSTTMVRAASLNYPVPTTHHRPLVRPPPPAIPLNPAAINSFQLPTLKA